MTETFGRMTETFGHMTETFGHMTETFGHMTETFGHMTETLKHCAIVHTLYLSNPRTSCTVEFTVEHLLNDALGVLTSIPCALN